MENFAERIIRFNQELRFDYPLPEGIEIMNPFVDDQDIQRISSTFYRKYYQDNYPRHILIGINPGRLGGGATGIPFTDTKRLKEVCGIPIDSVSTHEMSSVFMYDMIAQYGGAEAFYRKFYINSMFPLALIRKNNRGKWVNCNYYDEKDLYKILEPSIIQNLQKQIKLGIATDRCYILGRKNATFFEKINQKEKLFDSFVVLDHPRYIEQYQGKNRKQFIIDHLGKLHLID